MSASTTQRSTIFKEMPGGCDLKYLVGGRKLSFGLRVWPDQNLGLVAVRCCDGDGNDSAFMTAIIEDVMTAVGELEFREKMMPRLSAGDQQLYPEDDADAWRALVPQTADKMAELFAIGQHYDK